MEEMQSFKLKFVLPFAGNGYHKWFPVCIWRDNGLHLQHRSAQAGPDYQGVDAPKAQQHP